MRPTHPPSEESFASGKQEHDQPDGTHEDDFDLILLGRREELTGSKPGNVRIRVTLPRHQPFHRVKEGMLEATEAAEVPEGALVNYIADPPRIGGRYRQVIRIALIVLIACLCIVAFGVLAQ